MTKEDFKTKLYSTISEGIKNRSCGCINREISTLQQTQEIL